MIAGHDKAIFLAMLAIGVVSSITLIYFGLIKFVNVFVEKWFECWLRDADENKVKAIKNNAFYNFIYQLMLTNKICVKLVSACCRDDNLKALEIIHKNGIPIKNICYKGVWPAIFWASWNNNPQIIAYLIEEGVEINSSNYFEDGCSELHICVEKLSIAAAECLLKRGADPMIKNFNMEAPLVELLNSNASKDQCKAFMNLFRKYGDISYLENILDCKNDNSEIFITVKEAYQEVILNHKEIDELLMATSIKNSSHKNSIRI